ncbi:MAG TPA: glucans biosynthesis glucosyltransferase MdoH [Usitatibacter sp.]|nr:glucans biosynthesis glucosyltransferase MdoH [Usitatibacter sp.]
MSAHEAVACYLSRLDVTPERRAELLAAAASCGDAREGLAAVHAALARADGASPPQESTPPGGNSALGSVAARLGMGVPTMPRTGGLAPRVALTPPLQRSSMAPRRWLGGLFTSRDGEAGPLRRDGMRPRWARSAALRRIILFGLVVAQSVVATSFLTQILPFQGAQPMEMAMIVIFAILFAWISSGFWTALAGFTVLEFGRDRHSITRLPVAPLGESARTALVMPICNEDVGRVFAGLRATCESLVKTGEAAHFEVFVLSDTGNPDALVAEMAAWLELRRALEGRLAVHYRWRRHHIKRKSGNIADFCRRWGKGFRYMVVVDADSVMTGDCLVRLAQLMEADPHAGIIQTAPRPFGRETLFARLQQFATAAYGPLFTAGLHFWQLGEAHYWGHNAILRVEPFMRHCALGRLPGDGALSGEILSHDFVEAALMRRAGWAVWIAYDLPGSYEEVPPNLIDELARDRRWCLGNLINLRLLGLEGVHPAHRAVFMIGVMAYASAPLWFLSLALGTALLAQYTLTVPDYFPQSHQLFPNWPRWHPEWAFALFSSTAVVLFLPKVLATILIVTRGAQAFGTGLRATASVAMETVFSALLAPIRMIFHTQFVVTGIAGVTLRWKSPSRADSQTGWSQALSRHGLHTLLGVGWTALVWWLQPAVLPWALPVAGALIVSIPISVLTSRVAPGRLLRRADLLLTPEEAQPAEAITRTLELARSARAQPGLAEAVIDPSLNALAIAAARQRDRAPASVREQREALVRRATVEGLEPLARAERARLLDDAEALAALHLEAWSAPDAHPSWLSLREGEPKAGTDALTGDKSTPPTAGNYFAPRRSMP